MTRYTFDDLRRGKFSKKAEARFRMASKEAVQEVANEANTPLAKGGRMPVDTGFLRASIAAAIDRMPSGPSSHDEPYGGHGRNTEGRVFKYDNEGVAAALLRWNPEEQETLFVGWSAEYARAMEYRYGFMRGAVENWDKIVDDAAKDAVRRIK